MKIGTLMRLGLWRLAIMAGMGLAGNTWASQVQVVTLAGFVFNPVAVSVVPGQAVQWTNQDPFAHTVTSDPLDPVPGGPDSGGGFGTGGTYSWIVPSNAVSGTTWYYHCAFHGSAGNGSSLGAGMAGMITVIGNGGILLATNALVFSATYQGVEPAEQTIGMTNVGVGGFTYTNVITYGAGAAGWLTVLPATDTIASNGATVLTNQVDITGLNAGTYYATNQVTAADATNSPQTVVAALTVAKADQAITNFPNPGSQVFTSTVHLVATASSGLAVTNFTVFAGPGVITGLTNLTFTGTGNISVVAAQASNTNWNPAPSVTNTFAVGRADQTITFATIPDQVVTSTVHLAATASSGLAVTNFTVFAGPGVITGLTNLMFTGTGSVSIVAAQAGNTNWNPAPGVTNTFVVGRLNQTITFPAIADQIVTNTVLLSATASSGLAVTNFTVFAGPGVITGLTNLTFTGTGNVSIVTAQAGNTNWNPAPNKTNTFAVGRADQIITFSAIPDQVMTSTVHLAATASSGLAVTNFTVAAGGGICTLTGLTNLTFTGTGNVSIAAAQAGNTNWNPAPNKTNTFNVGKATAQVALTNLSQTYDGTPRVVTASSVPSGLSVLLTYDGSATAPVNAGSYAVNGTVSDTIYAGAADDTLVVAKANQAIAFPAIPDQVATGIVNLSATASSGLAVAFAVNSGPAMITGGTTLSFTGTGEVSIAASQDGNGNWNAAATAINTFHVTAIPVIGILNADFDGDRKADPAIYDQNTGTWTLKLSGSGYAQVALAGLLGGIGWTAAAADYDGDRLSDPAVYQESSGNWIVLQSGSGYARLERGAFLGGSGWVEASADYDGDKKSDYAVYEEATGNWKVKISSGGYSEISLNNFLGGPGFSIASADYDGDGLADPAVYNRTDGTWQVLLSGASYAPVVLPVFLGGTGWSAVPGDYDGDGKADPAVRKADGSEWRIRLSGSGYVLVAVPLDL